MGFELPAEQVLVMFGLIALGWLALRLGWIEGSTQKGMTNLLIYLVSPAVTIQAFLRPFDAERLRMMGVVFVVDVAAFAISIWVANLIFNRRLVPDAARRVALRFGTVYSNAGFMGIPLAQALLGNDGVFYAVVYVAAYTVFVWTHGAALFGTGEDPLRVRLRRVILNPGIVGILVALPMFLFSVSLPLPVTTVLGHLAAMNTPLSMLVVGISLAGSKFRQTFTDGFAWTGVLARNVLVPALFVVLLGMAPLDPVARLAVLISVSAPVGAFLVIFSVRHDHDPRFAVRLLCLSTLLSLVTLPAVLTLAQGFWAG